MPQYNVLSVYLLHRERVMGKKTAGENAQQRHHLYPEGEKKHFNNSKKRAASKEKDERGQRGHRREQASTAHMKAKGKWSRVDSVLLTPEVRRETSVYTHMCLSTWMNVLQRLITMMYGHISLINEKAEQQQEREKKDSLEEKLFGYNQHTA